MIFLIALLVGSAAAQDCATELKDFQTCIESWTSANQPQMPPKPSMPNMLEIATRASACFTDNNCADPVQEMMAKMGGKRGAIMPPMDSDSPFPVPPMHKMEKMIKKAKCVMATFNTHMKDTIQTCVQERISGWEWPSYPGEDEMRLYDPFGEGPLGCKVSQMWHRYKMMKAENKGESVRVTRGAHRGRKGKGGGDHGMKKMMKKMMKMIAAQVYGDSCPADSRSAVSSCLAKIHSDVHGDMCTKMPNKMEMVLNMVSDHDKFCDNRASCYAKISESCQSNFWDQKYYMSRCFFQVAKSVGAEKWEEVSDEVMACIDGDDDDDDDDDESESESESESGSSSSEEGKGGNYKVKKVWYMMMKAFGKPMIKDPCYKWKGVYKYFLMDHKPHGGKGRHGGDRSD